MSINSKTDMKRTLKEVASLAKTLSSEREKGHKVPDLAEKYDIDKTYVYALVRKYQAGKFDGKEIGGFNDLIETVTNECGRLTIVEECDEQVVEVPELINIIIYNDHDFAKSIEIEVENPKIEDHNNYELELQKRILTSILKDVRWTFAGKEFKGKN